MRRALRRGKLAAVRHFAVFQGERPCRLAMTAEGIYERESLLAERRELRGGAVSTLS
jgi:hypothetical protein